MQRWEYRPSSFSSFLAPSFRVSLQWYQLDRTARRPFTAAFTVTWSFRLASAHRRSSGTRRLGSLRGSPGWSERPRICSQCAGRPAETRETPRVGIPNNLDTVGRLRTHLCFEGDPKVATPAGPPGGVRPISPVCVQGGS